MSSKTIILMITMVACVSLVAGCRKDEQGRQLSFEKGVYQGATDHSLTEQQQKSLRERAIYQGH